MPLFAVLYRYDDRSADRDTHRADHRVFLRDLLEKDVLLAAGAYSDDAEPGALLLLRSPDSGAVHATLAADPFVIQGLVTEIDVREWSGAIGPWAV